MTTISGEEALPSGTPMFLQMSYSYEGSLVKLVMIDSAAVSSESTLIGLPPGKAPVKPPAGDFSYSGMHDAGPLPPPREGGPMATLITMVQHAKKINDLFLTQVIQDQQAQKQQHHTPGGESSPSHSRSQISKKAKLGENLQPATGQQPHRDA